MTQFSIKIGQFVKKVLYLPRLTRDKAPYNSHLTLTNYG